MDDYGVVNVILIAGVAGSGKSTVGLALATRLGWRFQDADDLHSPEAIDQMRRGVGLDDAQRQPWLARVRAAIDDAVAQGEPLVVACSALKARYRDVLTHGIRNAAYVFLRADRALLEARLAGRQGHFAGTTLLDSQLAALEMPREALIVDASQSVEVIVTAIVDELCLNRGLPTNPR